jgi:hypothetical protein
MPIGWLRINSVILSEAGGSRSEPSAKSKDPFIRLRRPKLHKEFLPLLLDPWNWPLITGH